MQKTSKRRRILFFLLPALLLLTACEAHGNFTVSEDGFGKITLNLQDDTGIMQMSGITCDALKSEIAIQPATENVEVIDNSTDDTYDCTLRLESQKSLVDNKTLIESGDNYILKLSNNQNTDKETLDMLSAFKFEFDFTVEMPGKIIKAEGAEIDGNKATFKDVTTLLTKGIEVEGKKFDDGSAGTTASDKSEDSDDADNKVLLLLIIAIVIFLLVLIFILVIFFGIRKKNHKSKQGDAFLNPYENNSGVNPFNAFSTPGEPKQQFTPTNNQVPEFFSAPVQPPAPPAQQQAVPPVPPAPSAQTQNNTPWQPSRDNAPDENNPYLKP